MNKLILTKGVDITCASEQVILDIAPNLFCFDEDQIVIVPDRYSLITEKLIFEKLNINSTLNIRVMGINRFASLVLKRQNIAPKSISSTKELICIAKAAIEERERFRFFPKDLIDVSFLQQIKNTIAQLKTSCVTTQALEGLIEENDKLHDIYLIYKNYEEKQKDGVDLADFLDVFIEHCDNSLADCRVYFAFFDSMTSQCQKIVRTLLRKTKSVEIALAHPQNGQKNKFVYDTELAKNLLAIAREEGAEIEEKLATSSNYLANVIAQNVYLSSPKQVEAQRFAQFWECSSGRAQIEAVAREIKSHVVGGGRFCDCVVALGDLKSNVNLAKRVFEEYEIPCFFDVDNLMSETKLAEFLKIVFRFELEKDPLILYDIFSNVFVGLERGELSEICQFIQKYSLVDQDLNLHNIFDQQDKKIYEKIQQILGVLKFQKIDKNGQIFGEDFVKQIRRIFEFFDVEKTIQNICEYHAKKHDLENQKIYEKIYDKFDEVLSVFEEETKNEKMAFVDFVTLFENVLESTKMPLVPLGVDVVFVGDPSKSFFEKDKIFFLCGANQDRMPDFQKDVGLLSDKDIARFSKCVNINPTIRTINIRKRMKLCSILSIPKQKLFVAWIALDEDGKKLVESTFVLGLMKMFGEKSQKIGFSGSENAESFAKSISNYSRGKEQLVGFLRAPKIHEEICYNSLFSVIKKRDPNIEKFLSVGAKKNIREITNKSLFFTNGKFSVSAMETYAKCPFMFFAKYGLRLKENQPIDLDEVTIGNIVHECLEKFFRGEQKDVEKHVDQVFDELSKSEKYQIFFAYKKYASVLSSLKRECKKTIYDILSEQQNSNFKIQSVEKYVGDKNLFDFDGRKISFGGVVDRVDANDGKIVVVDYKTGKVEHSISDIEFGNKIQIFIYLRALEKCEGVRAVGALYLPISAKRKKSTKMFEGFFVDEEIGNFDTTFDQEGVSKVLGVKKKKDGSISSRNRLVTTREEFQKLSECAQAVMEQNLKNISNGYISPSPLKTNQFLPCAYCKFLGICKFDQDCGDKHRIQRKKSDEETR